MAVDLGQSRIKAILAERVGNRIDVLHAFTLDLQEEGLLSAEETNRHISRILLEMGEYPVSLVVPQHVAVSHLIGLPVDRKARWERLIEEETQKLIGLSESAIVYDHVRLRPFQRQRNPVWVTVTREQELENQIRRVAGSGLEIGEITNTGNALASAYIATQAPEKRVVLADIGATSTTVVILDRMQPVYATSLPFGGELFTQGLAAAKGCSFDEAEVMKKTEVLFQKEGIAADEFLRAVERWQEELERIILEWVRDQAEQDDEPVKVALTGGSSLQPGFTDHLASRSTLQYVQWRDNAGGVDPQTYGVAYGAALAALKAAPVSSSLLPRPLRVQRQRSRQIAALNTLALLLLAGVFALLVADGAAKRRVLEEKAVWIRNLEEALAQTEDIEDLLSRRRAEYNKIVPIVQQQKRTRDLLQTIALMQEVRAGHELWFVTLADGKSYLDEATVNPPRNPSPAGRPGRNQGQSTAAVERTPPGWNRFVVELAVPGEPREAREALRSVVNAFNSRDIFRNVDSLPAADRRQVAEKEVTLPGQTFSLNLELIPSELPLPAEENGASSPLSRP